MATAAEIRKAEDERLARAGGFAAATKRQREIDADEEQQRRQAGMLDSVKGLLPDFGFGTILLLGLAYLVMKINPELMDGIVKMLPKDWQANIAFVMNKIGIDVDMRAALEGMPQDERRKKLSAEGSEASAQKCSRLQQ